MPESVASGIYDLGYRPYDGPRLGTWSVLLTLYRESLRGAFGVGRPTTAKIAPAALIILALLPAVVQVAIGLFAREARDVLKASDYYNTVKFILALYCAAVAPDLVGRDQRNHTLCLYFSRAVRRRDYAITKFAAMTTAMLVITLLPQALLLVGNGLATRDVAGYLRTEWDEIGPIVSTGALGSAVIAAIGVAVAAQTPRRTFATFGIVLAFVPTLALSNLLVLEIDTDGTHYGVFFSPFSVIEGFTAWIFNAAPGEGSPVLRAGFAGGAYVIAAGAMICLASAALLRRYQRVPA